MSACFKAAVKRVSRSSSSFSAFQRSLGVRCLHQRRPLPYSVQEGLGDFLPPQALQALVKYQDGLLSRLNDEVRNDPTIERHSSVVQTVLHYATRKERTLAFNYAVLALNNSFFLEQLASQPDHQHKASSNLFEAIRSNYGDMTNLKSTFSATALGMFSNGWVWLVSDTAGKLGVLPTFGPSTLLIRSRSNMHSESFVFNEEIPDANTTTRFTPASSSPTTPPTSPLPTSGASGSSPFSGSPFTGSTPGGSRSVSRMHSFRPESIIPGDSKKDSVKLPEQLLAGRVLYPLFCIPVYEHAWMSAGYDILGKEEWLKQFWSVLDWGKVSKSYEFALSGQQQRIL